MLDNIKKGLFELLKTLSSKDSFFSSKRLERVSFIGTALFIIIGTFFFLIYKGTLTSTDAIILSGPLLVAAGYNLIQTEKAKKDKENDNG